MLATMASTKTAKPTVRAPRGTGRAPAKAPSPPPDSRPKSGLVEIGEDAMRAALLAELQRQGWNLTRTAEALRMSAPSNVIRAIKSLDLEAEYEAAKARGEARPGRPKVAE